MISISKKKFSCEFCQTSEIAEVEVERMNKEKVFSLPEGWSLIDTFDYYGRKTPRIVCLRCANRDEIRDM